MRYIKMFIAGLAFPSFLIPFIYLTIWYLGISNIYTHPFIHFIPLIWGIWNIISLKWLTDLLPGGADVKLLLTGAIFFTLSSLFAGSFGSKYLLFLVIRVLLPTSLLL